MDIPCRAWIKTAGWPVCILICKPVIVSHASGMRWIEDEGGTFLGWFFRISVMPVGYMVQVAVKGIGFRHAGQAVSGTGDRIAAGKGTGG